MSISLKSLVAESVNYIPPHVDVTKSTRGGTNPATKAAARQLFYDFYAMDFLHRQFGPSHMTTGAKVKAAMGDPNFHTGFASGANWDEVDYPLSQVILNKKFVDVIEHVHEQVTREISRKLIAYLRLGLVQELRHMMTACSGWREFRQDLASKLNLNKKITMDDFKRSVKDNIPMMINEIPSVMRLLKFSKYYSKMSAYNNEDPYDAARQTVSVIGKPLHKKSGTEEPEVSPEEPEVSDIPPQAASEPSVEEPDDTDYNTEVPDYPDYEYPTGEFDPEDPYDKKKKLKEGYASGRISPSTIKKINDAFNKAELTWKDVDNAYNKIPWGGGYGGPRWGTGSHAFLKLVPQHKDMDTEQMASLVDHIFDLEHNTGGLLNKGGMNMDDEDLDRRAKATHVARYLPFVSSVVKRLILMFLKYFPGDPEQQKNIDSILNSPTKPFTPEEDKILKDNKFFDDGDARKANIRFFSKKKDDYGNAKEVHGRYYEAKSHADGKYTLADDLKADVQVFDKFEDLAKYINSFKNDIKAPSSSPSGVYTPTPTPKSEKDIYLSSHSKIKLPKEKEEALYAIKMGWRPSSKCYKAYFSGTKRYRMYAFSDGTFLCAFDHTNDYKVFNDWNVVMEYNKLHATGANDSHQSEAKSYIGLDPNKVVEPAEIPQKSAKDFEVSSLEQQAIAQLVKASFPETSTEKYNIGPLNNGLLLVQKNSNGSLANCFSVGKSANSSFGKAYKVNHYIGSSHPETWGFNQWVNAFEFIKNHINKLVVQTIMAGQVNTSFTSPILPPSSPVSLPPNATSNASYKVHIGITEPPKVSMRLTKEDEDAIGALGFEPKMIGQDVWYIHKIAKDAVRFYANDLAKLVFTNKNGASGPATLKFDIAKMLSWLAANYTPTTTTSPLQSGAAPTIQKGNATGASMVKAGGIQAGSIFEKRIANAGFIWDASKNYYLDGTNTLVIHKDRQSDLDVNGEILHFNNLPDLINFLSDDYPDKKKSNKSTIIPKTNAVTEINQLLTDHGVLDPNGNIVDTQVQDPFSPGSGAMILSKIAAIKLLRQYASNKTGKPAGLAECKWAVEHFHLFLDYVSENGLPDMNNGYGFILQWANDNPNLTSQKNLISSENSDGISPTQYEQVIKPNIEGYGPDIWSEYITGNSNQPAYVDIFKKLPAFGDMGSVVLSLGQIGNYYQINNKDGKPLQSFDTFNSMIAAVKVHLNSLVKQKFHDGPTMDGISKLDTEKISSVVESVGDEFWVEYVNATEHPSAFGKTNYVEILKKSSSTGTAHVIFTVGIIHDTSHGQSEVLYQINDYKNKPIKQYQTLPGLLYDLTYVLKSGNDGYGEKLPPDTGIPPTMPFPSKDPNELSEGEINKLNSLLDTGKTPTLVWKTKSFNLSGHSYLSLFDNATKKEYLAVFKNSGGYSVDKIIDNKWEPISITNKFDDIYIVVDGFIDMNFQSSVLTEDEREWIISYINLHKPNIDIAVYEDKSVIASNPVSSSGLAKTAIFQAKKSKSGGYQITYTTTDGSPKQITTSFKNFHQMQEFIKENLQVITQKYTPVYKPTDVDMMGKLPEVLAHAKFVLVTNSAINPKDGSLYENDKEDKILFCTNGKSQVLVHHNGKPIGGWQEFETPNQLVKWIVQTYGDVPISEDEVVEKLLKNLGYQNYSADTSPFTSWINSNDGTINIYDNGAITIFPEIESESIPPKDIHLNSIGDLKKYLSLKHNSDQSEANINFHTILSEAKFHPYELPIDSIYKSAYKRDSDNNTVSINKNGAVKINLNGTYTLYSNVTDAAFVLSEHYKLNAKNNKSFSKGLTGDTELDLLIKNKNFIFSGHPIGDMLAMIFVNHGNGSKLTIYDDYSSRYDWPSSDSVKGAKQISTSFKDLSSLENFLNLFGGDTPAMASDESYSISYYDTVGPAQQVYSIRLKKEDEARMNAIGWTYVPSSQSQSVNAYINKEDNYKLVFFNKFLNANKNKPVATLYLLDGTQVLDFISDDFTIEKVIQYWENLKKNPESVGKSPFSNENYDVSPFKDDIKEIELNEQDTNALEKIGFEHNEHQEFYIKTIETDIQESTFEDEPENNSDDYDLPPYDLPPDMQQDDTPGKYEIIVVYNNGIATWDQTDYPHLLGSTGEGKESKQGKIKEILEFVWNRWKSSKKPIESKPSNKIESQLQALGFVFTAKMMNDGWEYTKIDSGDSEDENKITFTHYVKIYPKTNTLLYSQYETNPDKYSDYLSHQLTSWPATIENGLTALQSVKDDPEEIEFSNVVYNTVKEDGIQKVIPLNKHDTDSLAKMGFKLDIETFGYPLYVRGEHENFAAYNDDTSHYVNNKTGVDLNFHSVKEGFTYLKTEYDKEMNHLFGKDVSNKDVSMEEAFYNLGLHFDDKNGMYVKMLNGKIIESVSLNDDDTLTYTYTNKNGHEVNFNGADVKTIIRKIKSVHNDSSAIHRIKTDAKNEEKLAEMGYHWVGGGIDCYVKEECYIFFQSNGKIFYHAGTPTQDNLPKSFDSADKAVEYVNKIENLKNMGIKFPLSVESKKLDAAGFWWEPTFKAYVRGKSMVKYVDSGKYYFWPNYKDDIDNHFTGNTLAQVLTTAQYHIQKSPTINHGTSTVTESGMPFSNIDYSKHEPKHETIRLTKSDEETLKKIGFEYFYAASEDPSWNKSYVKDQEVMYFFPTQASYWVNGDGPKYIPTVKGGMEFLWNKSDKSIPFDPDNSYIGKQLEEMGFKKTYSNSGGTQYFKSKESGKKITIVMLNNGMMRYKAIQDVKDAEPLLIDTWEIKASDGLSLLKGSPDTLTEEKLSYKSIMRLVLE